jgi:hypothetical protein
MESTYTTLALSISTEANWFARTLSWCEKVCDSRVLHRLVRTVTEPGNVFARLFDHTELQGLLCIVRQMRHAQAQARLRSKIQGVKTFCVNRALAKLWRPQNADCICLPHAAAADWLH